MNDKWPVLSGDLCYLRVLTEDDAKLWHLAQDDGQLLDEPGFEMGASSTQRVRNSIRQRRLAWSQDGGRRHWGVWTIGTNELAGGVQLTRGIGGGPDEDAALISWVIWREFFSEEIAAEAVSLAAAWCRQHLANGPLVALAEGNDSVGARVLRRAGFRLDGPSRPWEAAGRLMRFVA